MATIRQRTSGTWEIIIRKKGILPRPHYASADSLEEANRYAKQIENLLDQGILPAELQSDTKADDATVLDWARRYLVEKSISHADRDLLEALYPSLSRWKTSQINTSWADNWISEMKQIQKHSPTIIKHKVGAVARMLDWCLRKNWISVNPLRVLDKNYAGYAPGDGEARKEVERDRRLEEGEEERIMEILNGKVPANKQRGIGNEDRPAMRLLFILAINTAMRLREMYTLTADQVSLEKRTIFWIKQRTAINDRCHYRQQR